MEKPSLSNDDAGDALPNNSSAPDSDIESERRRALPTIDLIDSRAWQFFENSNDDDIAFAVATAKHWASNMESLLSQGSILEDIWEQTYQQSCEEPTARGLRLAVIILSRSWRHGEALSKLFYDNVQAIDHSENDTFKY